MRNYLGKFFLFLCALSALPLAAQSDPRAVAAVRAAVNSQIEADRTDRTDWIYNDHDVTEEHDNTSICVGSPQGELCRVLKRHNLSLNANEEQAETDRIAKYVHDPAEQARNKKNSAHDDVQATALLKMLPDAYIWTVTSESPEYLTLAYRPDPKFDPPSMQARVMCQMAGQFVIAKKGNLIRSFTGTLTEDVKIGFGILGRLNKGGHIDIERRDVGNSHWEITEEHVHIGGHALFFKTIGTQQDDIKINWHPSPAHSLQEAEEHLRTTH